MVCKAKYLALGQEYPTSLPKNEGTEEIPRSNVQWQLTAIYHDWNPGHLPRPIDADNQPLFANRAPKKDSYMTYPEKNIIDESIHKNLRKKDVYESDMHKI